MLTVDLRWAWTPEEYDTTFVVAEVGALHLPGLRADPRWDPCHYNGLHNSSTWFDMVHAQPLREALLTHWHTTFTGAEISLSLNDSPVPLDEYDDYRFTHRRLVRPSSPPWETGSGQPILRYLSRLADGGPRVPDDYKALPSGTGRKLGRTLDIPGAVQSDRATRHPRRAAPTSSRIPGSPLEHRREVRGRLNRVRSPRALRSDALPFDRERRRECV